MCVLNIDTYSRNQKYCKHMSNFNARKQRGARSAVFKPFQQEIERVPRQFCDYMSEENSRFCEICNLYLEGLSMDDVRYLKPEDLIALVPHDHYKHKLLMTIMVRRYLYRPEECKTMHCKQEKTDDYEKSNKNSDNIHSIDTKVNEYPPTKCMYVHNSKTEYSCNNCDHICINSECNHTCN